jgi:hypothetical protein
MAGGNTDKQNLDIHDNNASWFNGGYALDVQGTDNNMNEEWFGICAKGPTNARGLYDLYPCCLLCIKRSAQCYPLLKELFRIC